jgi:hypothetical protein
MPLGDSGPFPLPSLELPWQTGSRSRRVQQRQRRATAVACLANEASSALNKLSLLGQQNKQSSNLSSTSLRMAQNVRSAASRFVSRCVSTWGVGDDFPDSHIESSSLYVTASTALPLDAEMVSLPEEGGSVDLLSLLPPDLAQRYSTPNPGLFRPPEDRRGAARAVLVKSTADWVGVVRRMTARGMVAFTTTPTCVNGVFAAPKGEGRQRLIIDARPANALFAEPPMVELPSPEIIAQLEAPGEFFVGKVDLDNFYHRLRLPRWMWPYFALPPVRAVEVGEGHRFGNDALIYPCCTTLPMGWSHSVWLAQTAHLYLLDTRTSLSSADRLVRGNDFLLNRTRHHVYIDDLNFFSLDEHELKRLQDEYIAVCRGVGLVIQMAKVVRPSRDGVECIGVEVHGRDRSCGVAPAKLCTLKAETERLLRFRRVSGVDLARLVGKWSWAFLVRRPAFAVFNAISLR